MKDGNLGQYLLWKGEHAKIVAEVNSRSVIIEMQDAPKCPHCEGVLEKHQFSVIPSSPLFQENAEQIPTITDDDTLIISE